MDEHVISRLDELGVGLFRINLSHTPVAAVEETVARIQKFTDVPVCLDTEGAQVRTGKMRDGTVLIAENAVLQAVTEPIDGDDKKFSLYPGDVVDRLLPGDLISIDFDAVLVQVTGVEPGCATMRVINGGRMGSNKAVSIQNRVFDLPPLTDKDIQALRIGADMGVVNAALSFANRAEDVAALRSAFREDGFVISKIECRNGIHNLDEILTASDAALIDRGDLSREFPLERIPGLQKHIIGRAKSRNVPVYVATNLLESMVTSTTPTRAEVNDVYNTLMDGADGLVLAAETAIGAHPVRCANMIARMIREFEAIQQDEGTVYSFDTTSGLIEPHGGRLVQREVNASETVDLDRLPRLTLDERDLMDCEQLATGTYSPLSGPMNRTQLEDVLEHHRLPTGQVWTLPIIFQVPRSETSKFSMGDRVVLQSAAGTAHAYIDLEEIYQIDVDDVTKRWFGTDTDEHPGVAWVRSRGDTVIAGQVTLISRIELPFRHYALTPSETRHIFAHKGWSRVVGFHTRNIAHKAHNFIQLTGLANSHADGIYINPVVGPKKPGDFLTAPIIKSYQLLIERAAFPAGKVMLGSFLTYSRYSGPREAVFTALCRKNMGCSHFIIGRDHTGVGDFYASDANRKLFDKIGDIGITPMFFDAVGYNEASGDHEFADDGKSLTNISGTQVRETLRQGDRLPDWFVDPAVQDMLLAEIGAGQSLFHE